MTALSKYDRLEATGLWRADPEAQRREVIVSIGNATLVIADINDRHLPPRRRPGRDAGAAGA